jgi:GTPase involved in cell partitioning and DNA repair
MQWIFRIMPDPILIVRIQKDAHFQPLKDDGSKIATRVEGDQDGVHKMELLSHRSRNPSILNSSEAWHKLEIFLELKIESVHRLTGIL